MSGEMWLGVAIGVAGSVLALQIYTQIRNWLSDKGL